MRAFVLCLALTGFVALALQAQRPARTANALLLGIGRFSYGTVVVKRALSEAYSDELIDRFAAATSKAIGTTADREHVSALLSQFDPLWDSTGKLVPGAVTRYALRVAAIPVSAVREWAALTGHDLHTAAFSLASLEGVWNGTAFGQPGFARLVEYAKRER